MVVMSIASRPKVLLRGVRIETRNTNDKIRSLSSNAFRGPSRRPSARRVQRVCGLVSRTPPGDRASWRSVPASFGSSSFSIFGKGKGANAPFRGGWGMKCPQYKPFSFRMAEARLLSRISQPSAILFLNPKLRWS